MNNKLLIILFLCLATVANAQTDLKKYLKFATFYAAANGSTSLSDKDMFSVSTGSLTQDVESTPFDYNLSFGVRKIARFGYENRANTFYDGTEQSWGDAATIGKVKGLEFLFELDCKRQFGENYLDQTHFLRYVADKYIVKAEYLEDGFADIEYFETSERYRYNINNKLSLNIGASQRLSEPYGYDPLEEWLLSNNSLHYTYLAIQEGYTINVYDSEYKDPDGNIVANSVEVWKEVVIPQVLANYVEKKRAELDRRMQQSLILGLDFYHYKKSFWLHGWVNVLPWHYNDGGEYSYHNYNNNEQWYDYSGGLIFGIESGMTLSSE